MGRFLAALERTPGSSAAKYYCRKWVAEYLEFAVARHQSAGDLSLLSMYLAQMAKQGRTQFQMDQARWAVLFFLNESGPDASGGLPSPVGDQDAHDIAKGSQEWALARSEGNGLKAFDPAPGLLDPAWLTVLSRLEDEVRLRRLSPKTLKAYRRWARGFGRWVGALPPAGVVVGHAKDFLTGLAHTGISSSTQNQAFSALRFLYTAILRKEFSGFEETPRAPSRVRFPDALSRPEAASVLRCMRPPWKLVAQVLYGTGLRLQEALSLRVQDVDFGSGLIRTYNAKGNRSRAVPLPRKLVPLLDEHLRRVRGQFEEDLKAGFGGSFLPDGLERKLPRSALEWAWQWVFPAMRLTVSSADGKPRRYHLHETGLQKEIKRAAAMGGLARRVSPHTFRHSFATEMLRMGYDIRIVQDLLGHADVATTMIYTHVLGASSGRLLSPLDL
jgi:integron integrase